MGNLMLLSTAYSWFIGLLIIMVVMTALFVVIAVVALRPVKMDSGMEPGSARKLLEKREAEIAMQLLRSKGDSYAEAELESRLRDVATAERVLKEIMAEEYGLGEEGTEEEQATTADPDGGLNKSFTAKLMQSSDEVKVWYFELKNCILCYEKTKDEMSWNNEKFYIGRKNVATLTMRGRTLSLYLALNPNEYSDSFPVRMTESANYSATPCLFRIKSEENLKSAKELIDLLMTDYGVMYVRSNHSVYALPYEDDDTLIVHGLAKHK